MINLFNGQPESNLFIADRGLAYGDGVFETIALEAKQPQLWQAHWQRLVNGLNTLGIEVDTAELQQHLKLDIQQALLTWTPPRGVLKIIITRGIGGRGYMPPAKPQLNRMVQILPWPEGREHLSEQGVHVHICNHVWGNNPQLAGIKHLNRLDQVLARQEWSGTDKHEGLMLNQAGYVQSGVMSNIFVEHNGCLYTPSQDGAGIAGIMAEQVMAIAHQLGVKVHQQHISMDFLRASAGVFFTNSLNGIWPVIDIAGQAFEVTDMTRQLQSKLVEHIAKHAETW